MTSSGYWNHVPYDFAATIENCIKLTETVERDLCIVRDSITVESVTSKEIALLNHIGVVATELNNKMGIDFHKDKRVWHCHENTDFLLVETLYAENRDFVQR